ncbi:hypothetical protein DENSPDRAFT_928808 [Dentipellis sp. KUC8613]|nr:hypothetical protein DENSPDRAFT_928808 [Dentipellis sp. KUC8613]
MAFHHGARTRTLSPRPLAPPAVSSLAPRPPSSALTLPHSPRLAPTLQSPAPTPLPYPAPCDRLTLPCSHLTVLAPPPALVVVSSLATAVAPRASLSYARITVSLPDVSPTRSHRSRSPPSPVILRLSCPLRPFPSHRLQSYPHAAVASPPLSTPIVRTPVPTPAPVFAPCPAVSPPACHVAARMPCRRPHAMLPPPLPTRPHCHTRRPRPLVRVGLLVRSLIPAPPPPLLRRLAICTSPRPSLAPALPPHCSTAPAQPRAPRPCAPRSCAPPVSRPPASRHPSTAVPRARTAVLPPHAGVSLPRAIALHPLRRRAIAPSSRPSHVLAVPFARPSRRPPPRASFAPSCPLRASSRPSRACLWRRC